MAKGILIAALASALSVAGAAAAAVPATGAQVIDRAAEALGGKAKVMGLKTLRQYGYGQNAYQDGGGNISASPRAPQKWINVQAQVRTIDYANNRMRVTQRNVQDFVFANKPQMIGVVRPNANLAGGLAYNLNAEGRANRASNLAARARRIDMLDNPVSIVRAAAQPGARLSAVRMAAGEQVVDLVTRDGDKVSVGVSPATHLPTWMRWVAPHENFGDVTYTTYFVGYQPSDGLNLPSGYNTVSSFRQVVQAKIYVDKYELDRAVDDLTPPANLASLPVPPDHPVPTIETTHVAPHIWYFHSSANGSSTAFEFKDHVVMFEAYGSEENILAILKAVRVALPGKPITHVIFSHHHIDHTGGLRAAVAEGLTVITNRGDNEAYMREVTGRPATEFPDDLQRKGRVGKIQVIPVDDKLVLKDDTFEVDIYRVTNNSHFAEGLFAYAPAARVVAQGDLVDEAWDYVWWGNSYPDSVAARKIVVDKDLPVHGHIHTWPEVMAYLKQQTKNAEALCASADAAKLPIIQGCPVSNTMDKY